MDQLDIHNLLLLFKHWQETVAGPMMITYLAV